MDEVWGDAYLAVSRSLDVHSHAAAGQARPARAAGDDPRVRLPARRLIRRAQAAAAGRRPAFALVAVAGFARARCWPAPRASAPSSSCSPAPPTSTGSPRWPSRPPRRGAAGGADAPGGPPATPGCTARAVAGRRRHRRARSRRRPARRPTRPSPRPGRRRAAQPAGRPAGTLLWPWSDEPLLLARPVGTGTRVSAARSCCGPRRAAAAADIALAGRLVLAGALAAAVARGRARARAGPLGAAAGAGAWPTRSRRWRRGSPAEHVPRTAARPSCASSPRLQPDVRRRGHQRGAAAPARRRHLAPAAQPAGRAAAARRHPRSARARGAAGAATTPRSSRPAGWSPARRPARPGHRGERATDLAAAARPAPADTPSVAAVVAERLDAWGPAADDAGVRLGRGGRPGRGGAPARRRSWPRCWTCCWTTPSSTPAAAPRADRLDRRRAGRCSRCPTTGPGCRPSTHGLAVERFWRAPGQQRAGQRARAGHRRATGGRPRRGGCAWRPGPSAAWSSPGAAGPDRAGVAARARPARRLLAGALRASALPRRAGTATPEPLVVAAGEPGGFYVEFAELLVAALRAAGTAGEGRRDRRQRAQHRAARRRLGRGRARARRLAQSAPGGARAVRPTPLPLQAIGRVYENYMQLVVRAEDPVRTSPTWPGGRSSLGAVGSGAAVFGDRLLADGRDRRRVEPRGRCATPWPR